jgi:hypothetical protein
MPVKNVQQQEMGKNLTGKQTQSSFRKSVRKAPGTRIGVLMDWREGSAKSGKLSGSYGHAVRDGR